MANTWNTTKQKGRPRRGSGQSTYSRMNKGRHSDRYSRPYLTGEYLEWEKTRNVTKYETYANSYQRVREEHGSW